MTEINRVNTHLVIGQMGLNCLYCGQIIDDKYRKQNRVYCRDCSYAFDKEIGANPLNLGG